MEIRREQRGSHDNGQGNSPQTVAVRRTFVGQDGVEGGLGPGPVPPLHLALVVEGLGQAARQEGSRPPQQRGGAGPPPPRLAGGRRGVPAGALEAPDEGGGGAAPGPDEGGGRDRPRGHHGGLVPRLPRRDRRGGVRGDARWHARGDDGGLVPALAPPRGGGGRRGGVVVPARFAAGEGLFPVRDDGGAAAPLVVPLAAVVLGVPTPTPPSALSPRPAATFAPSTSP